MFPSRVADDKVEARLFSPGPPLLGILLLAFALRVWQLGEQSLWYDEAVSVFIARQPTAELIAHTAGDIHPPLYYLLLHTWLTAAGTTEFAASYLSLFFGMLLVALVFRLARATAGIHAAVIAAILTAVSSFNLWYSQEVRMYTLVGCLAVLSLILLARLWERATRALHDAANGASQGWSLADQIGLVVTAQVYALVVALGLYSHYYFVFLWVFEYALVSGALALPWARAQRAAARRAARGEPQSAALQTRWRSMRPLILWTGLQLLVVALFAPWLPTALRQAFDPPVPPWRSFVAWPSALSEAISALAVGQSLPAATGWLLVCVVTVLYAFGIVAWGRSGTGIRTTISLVGATMAPLLLILLVSIAVPLYHVRYIFIYAAFFYVVLAAGIAWVGRRSLIVAVVLLGIFVGGSLYAEYYRRFDATYAKDDYRSAVQTIAARVRPGDAVLIDAGYIYPAFFYYYPGAIGWRGRLDDYHGDERANTLVVAEAGSLHASPDLGWNSPTSDFYATDEQRTASALDRLLSTHTRIWVLRANDTVNDPDGFIRRYLSTHALEFDEVTVRGDSFVKVQGFVARATTLTLVPANSVDAAFGERVTLVGWSGVQTATAGSEVPLSLWWKASAPMDVDYHMSLALYDTAGMRWGGSDGVPVGSLLPTGDWPAGQVLPADAVITVPLGTPPGDYALQLAVYDPLTARSLPVPSGADGTRARLGTIHVVRAPAAARAQSPPGFLASQPVFDGRVELAQAKFGPSQVRPGDAIHAELMWHALSAPLDDVVVFFQLLDDKGRLWAAQESAPVDGRYPTSQWTSGEYVRDARDLSVPPDMPDGRYRVLAGLFRARDRERLPVRTGWMPFSSDAVDMGTVEVKGREHVMQAPSNVGTPAHARFGDNALLIGYDVQAPNLSPGSALTLTVTLQALAPSSTALKVFVHLVGANEQIIAQHDSEPGDGTLPTTGWLAGEYLSDRYVLELPSGLAAGEYSLYIGFYDPQTTVRLSVFDADNTSVGDRWLVRKLMLR